MSDNVTRLGVAVIAFERVRQADIFLREHALIYWMAEGERSLRFHQGDCYMRTPSAAFQQHRGIPPDHGRVQSFLVSVEGVFRRSPPRMQRTLEGLMAGLLELLRAAAGPEGHSEEAEKCFFHACLLGLLRGDQSRRGVPRTRHVDVEAEEGVGRQRPVASCSRQNCATREEALNEKKKSLRRIDLTA